MPSPADISNLRSTLEQADDATFSAIVRNAGYCFPPSEKLLIAPNKNKLFLNEPTTFARYLELTGYSVAQVRQQVVNDVCSHANSNQDQFWAMFQSAGLSATADQQTSVLNSIREHTEGISESTQLTAERLEAPRFYRDWRFWSLLVAIVAAVFGGWRLWLALKRP